MKLSKIPIYLSLASGLGVRDGLSLAVNLPYFLLRKVLGTRYLERRINDYRMLLDLDDRGISKELMLFRTREREHIEILKSEIQPGMTVLDIGANIGYYAIMLALWVGGRGRVFAVEPSRANYAMLGLNIGLNGLDQIVETYNFGISNETGSGEFYESEKSNWHTFYPKVHSGSSTESLDDKASILVPVVSMKDFVADKGQIDFIRMDIEGFEVEVFEGMAPLLESPDFAPKILFEVHQPRYDDREHNMRRWLEHFDDKGYRALLLASNQHGAGGAEAFLAKGYRPERVIRTNYQTRGLFRGVKMADAIALICETDFVRAALLERSAS